MGIHEGRGQLSKAIKELTIRWQETRRDWDDSRTEQFEREHIAPIETDLKSAMAAMDHMASLLSEVRRNCQ